jgi:hypothetical protein
MNNKNNNQESFQEQYFRKKIEFKNNLIKNIKDLGIAIMLSVLIVFLFFSLFGGFLYTINIDKQNKKEKDLQNQIGELQEDIALLKYERVFEKSSITWHWVTNN